MSQPISRQNADDLNSQMSALSMEVQDLRRKTNKFQQYIANKKKEEAKLARLQDEIAIINKRKDQAKAEALKEQQKYEAQRKKQQQILQTKQAERKEKEEALGEIKKSSEATYDKLKKQNELINKLLQERREGNTELGTKKIAIIKMNDQVAQGELNLRKKTADLEMLEDRIVSTQKKIEQLVEQSAKLSQEVKAIEQSTVKENDRTQSLQKQMEDQSKVEKETSDAYLKQKTEIYKMHTSEKEGQSQLLKNNKLIEAQKEKGKLKQVRLEKVEAKAREVEEDSSRCTDEKASLQKEIEQINEVQKAARDQSLRLKTLNVTLVSENKQLVAELRKLVEEDQRVKAMLSRAERVELLGRRLERHDRAEAKQATNREAITSREIERSQYMQMTRRIPSFGMTYNPHLHRRL